MRIAFASGKGGAGKTTVAASLAVTWPKSCILVDADVEEPNLHLFVNPNLVAPKSVFLPVPKLNQDKCTACGACGEICSYKAIAILAGKPVIFSDMCHGCGGCFAVCPSDALDEGKRELGNLQYGSWSLIEGRENTLLMGRSRVGEAMSPPLLRALKKSLDEQMETLDEIKSEEAEATFSCSQHSVDTTDTMPDIQLGVLDDIQQDIQQDTQLDVLSDAMTDAMTDAQSNVQPDVLIDAPPGVSCPAMTTARLADALVLVAESTPFGMYDFTLAYQAFSQLNIPLAVVMNRVGMQGNESGDELLSLYCKEKSLPVLARLPFERQVAEDYARGKLPPVGKRAEALVWHQRFERLGEELRLWVATTQRRMERGSPFKACDQSTLREKKQCAK